MTVDQNQAEAQRRVREACRLIQSAYRLAADLRPSETLLSVRSAICEGANEYAADIAEEVERAR